MFHHKVLEETFIQNIKANLILVKESKNTRPKESTFQTQLLILTPGVFNSIGISNNR